MSEVAIKKVWDELAIKILSSVLVDHGAYFPVADVVGSDTSLWPPQARLVWRVIMDCVETNTLPTLEAIKLGVKGNSQVLPYLDYLMTAWNDEDNARVIYHAEYMKQVGLVARAREIGRELAGLDDVNGISEAIAKADVGLSSITSVNNNRANDAKSVSDSAWDMVKKFGGDGIPTGLNWFDRATGGLWPGFIYWIVAAYKSGKTTLIRNMILNMVRAGYGVDMLCAEGSRELFTLGCQAMIATGLMLDRGLRTDDLRLSALFILRTFGDESRRAMLTKDEYECVTEAKALFEKLPIRVHDSLDGIRDLATIKHIVKRSKLNYDSRVFVVDYSQLIGVGEIYARQSNTALEGQSIAVKENVAMVMLAQKNEAAVKGDSGHSSGVKGGGDADATSDFTMIPSIDENGFKITLKHSRWTPGGISKYHITNPSSGLIIDRWMDKDIKI